MPRYKETPSLSMPDAFKQATQRIVEVKGRSRRSEYWWMMLIVVIASVFLTPIFGLAFSILTIPLTFRRLHDTGKSGWWYGIYLASKLLIFPIMCYDIFRFAFDFSSNIDPEGRLIYETTLKYSFFILWIIVYKIILIIFCCLDSDKQTNKYGASPKYTDEDTQNENTACTTE